MSHEGLTESLRDNIAQWGYTEPRAPISIEGVEGVVLATPRRKTVRYLCGVFTFPDDVDTPEQAKAIFEAIRKGLTKKYAQFPYWKELGTYLVIICGSGLFDSIKGRLAMFKDGSGLHMNVMLGTIFVDQQEFRSSAECTWGLFYSGKHFGALSATANEWCKQRRRAQLAAADAGEPRR